MCRLAYITKRWRQREMRHWLHTMVESFGGDGNGVAVGDQCYKGTGVSVTETLTAMGGNASKPALWHTRRISIGGKCDALCHPFACAGGWLVHNGHWRDGTDTVSMMVDLGFQAPLSDTQLFAMLVDRHGFIPTVNKHRPNGVWLYMDKAGDLVVWKSGGDLWYSSDLECWGSEPCTTRGEWYRVKNNLYIPGDEPEEDGKKDVFGDTRSNNGGGCYSLWDKDRQEFVR